jgi:hypothetical protein
MRQFLKFLGELRHRHMALLQVKKFLFFPDLKRQRKILLFHHLFKILPVHFYSICHHPTLSVFPPILRCTSELISCINHLIFLGTVSHKENLFHMLDPPLSFRWLPATVELRGMVPVILSESWISHNWRRWMWLMHSRTLLHSCGPLLLRLSVLLNLLLHHMHHLLILLHHLCSHLSIRVNILRHILINSWPASSSSCSRHFRSNCHI